ncbi:hypothetical protein [Actinopolymorpha pittospori]|uniref:PD-(D/E)XK nuclease superfamily protein n=1 Tax=Actinopolymorpha pittospori TaxID=648752 RepID=A0A927MT97_9ACTN|nr:hypothetical protein [Actinopolymorpha pittospori]MBE1606234.1 hypothetical protein [Actinopolymorpha pittospori]
MTSVVNMLPKGFLKFWASKAVAEYAVENLGELVGISMRDKSAAVDLLKRAPDRDTARAAEVGTEVHDVFEGMARGEAPRRLHPDIKVYADHFQSFLAEFEPEFVFMEETVWSEKHSYAGSFDVLGRIGGELVIGDWKTTRSGVHEEVALQLSAYRHADYIIRPDGSKVPMPDIEGGFVLHVRPEGWGLFPIRCDEAVFKYFLSLREVFDWDREIKGGVIGNPINTNPSSGATSGPRTRAPRKAATK